MVSDHDAAHRRRNRDTAGIARCPPCREDGEEEGRARPDDGRQRPAKKVLIIVHTGAGKGKSSSAFGMILRCVAHGFPCAVVQFIKGAWDTGERRLLTGHFGDLCQFHAMGEGFTWETQDRARDIAAAARAGKRRRS